MQEKEQEKEAELGKPTIEKGKAKLYPEDDLPPVQGEQHLSPDEAIKDTDVKDGEIVGEQYEPAYVDIIPGLDTLVADGFYDEDAYSMDVVRRAQEVEEDRILVQEE